MNVVIVGAGSVGRSIARELINNGHEVLLIDQDADEARTSSVPEGSWLLADACETSTLEEAELSGADVVVCATGDDKVNLVVSLLAKTEYGVPRTVARVSNPRNEWMFDEAWGVDVAVSTPRIMTALVEEAVSVGALVRLFEFQQGRATMTEITLPPDSDYVGRRLGELSLPPDCVLTCIIRDETPIAPTGDDALAANDELIFVTTADAEPDLASMLTGRRPEQITRIARDAD